MTIAAVPFLAGSRHAGRRIRPAALFACAGIRATARYNAVIPIPQATPTRGWRMTTNGLPPQAAPAVTGRSTPLPGANTALALLLAINLFNFVDRQVLAAVEP